MKQSLQQGLRFYRLLTYRMRLMPNFIIIGAQKCGTTSLHKYLKEHPYVDSFQKAAHFFDLNFNKGIKWYRAQFPSIYMYYLNRVQGRDFLTGEASPYYIFHPMAPQRIFEAVPRVRLIALLRNPIDRAYSHYKMVVRKGAEPLTFEQAIEKEEERLWGEREKLVEDGNYDSFNYQTYSYLSRGIYVDQLKVWMSLFPREQILVLKSEDFYADPPTTLRRVFEFLDLPNWEPKDEYKKYNSASYANMDANMRKRLIAYFEPHNQRLYDYLGVNLDWDR